MLSVVNKGSVNIHAQVFVGMDMFIYLGKCQGM